VSYLSLRFDATEAEAERWSDALLQAGALSVDVSDPAAGTDAETPLFGEPGMPAGGSWPIARIVALFAGDQDPYARLREVAAALELPAPPHEVSPVADQDWVRATQAQFGPIAISSRLWIVPTWSAPPDAQAISLRLDPGLAFGTGSHPTTRLCLEWLEEQLHGGESLLDYGCGSGILAIAAKKLGAGSVAGVDLDPQAITASRANARLNDADCVFGVPGELPPTTGDIVVANILANPLIVLAPLLSARVKAGGAIALSGILDDQSDDVVAAYARWFTLAPWRHCDGWVLLTGQRRP
jgi:ribosomal protein L11 methyltransferase